MKLMLKPLPMYCWQISMSFLMLYLWC